MNPVLQQLIDTDCTESPNGEIIRMHSQIPAVEGDFLQALIHDLNPKVTLEVGLAFGVSALYILDALEKQTGSCHIVIDPCQYDQELWKGCGIRNIEKAGFKELVEFHHAPSYQALPEPQKAGRKIDFAFIDGWHTFDFSFVDFFTPIRCLTLAG